MYNKLLREKAVVCGGSTRITAMTLLFALQVSWLKNGEDFVANYRHC